MKAEREDSDSVTPPALIGRYFPNFVFAERLDSNVLGCFCSGAKASYELTSTTSAKSLRLHALIELHRLEVLGRLIDVRAVLGLVGNIHLDRLLVCMVRVMAWLQNVSRKSIPVCMLATFKRSNIQFGSWATYTRLPLRVELIMGVG